MSPAHAMTLEEVESKPSKKPKRAIGKDEKIKLQKGTAVSIGVNFTLLVPHDLQICTAYLIKYTAYLI